MATAGPNSPTTGADDATVGSVVWQNPGNVTASDNTRAAATLAAQTSHYLKITGFGFSIPAGATISGILVEIERSQGTAQNTKDNSVKLVIAGAITGNEKADTSTVWPLSAAETYATYGAAADKWGTTPTVAQVNASDFGVAFSAVNSGASVSARVDHARVTVYYSGAALTQSVVDTVTLADTVGKAARRTGADTAAVADTAANAARPSLADTVTPADTIAKVVTATQADTVTVTDATAKLTSHATAETVALADAICDSVALGVTDGIAVTDGTAHAGGYARSLTDLFAVVDAIANHAGPRIGEAVLTLVDGVVSGAIITFHYGGDDDPATTYAGAGIAFTYGGDDDPTTTYQG